MTNLIKKLYILDVLVSQSAPVKPTMHLQVKVATPSTHEAPFMQVFMAHSSTSKTKR